MCMAPLLHKRLPLAARCEIALSGYLALDLFKLKADQKCEQLYAPTGSTYMAPQTQHNLQGVALMTAVICCTKEATWSPWTYGQSRLSELSVEEWFSHLRKQSPNSQLSCRAYWKAGARTQLSHGQKLLECKAIDFKEGEPALTEEQLLGNTHVKSVKNCSFWVIEPG